MKVKLTDILEAIAFSENNKNSRSYSGDVAITLIVCYTAI